MIHSSLIRHLLAAAIISFPLFGKAEDIDLFQANHVNSNKPNILIILDNSSNWSQRAEWNGNPDGSGTQGAAEVQAIREVVSSLNGNVRVGLMMLTQSGSNKSGYLRYGIRDMTGSTSTGNKGALINLLTGLQPDVGATYNKISTSSYSGALREAYQYFSGLGSYLSLGSSDPMRDYTGNGNPTTSPYKAGSLAGNPLTSSSDEIYDSPWTTDALCAKNFIIFIGNEWNNTTDTTSGLGTDVGVSTDATPVYTALRGDIHYGDEWARYLHKTGAQAKCTTNADGSTGSCADNKITTYTVNVCYNSCTPTSSNDNTQQEALLKSMASVGGGRFFRSTSLTEIKNALQTIFNEIQAVNSIFTSASLPVSVNTQGTYLNQIYMGVFRPDGGGAPRWMGNLKQFKFGLTTTATGYDQIYLADSTGAAAVNTNTGFITPSAISYWTTPISPQCTGDATKGFWCFNPTGVGEDRDSPDGDLVEKGGAAQRLRAQGPSGRTMYTCTSSTSCVTGTAPNDFSTSNTSLVTALTGTSRTITSLSRSGSTVSVTTSGDLNLTSPSDSVTISGSSAPFYNTLWNVQRVDATHFTFNVTETPATPIATSGILVTAGSPVSQAVTPSNMTYDSGTATVTVVLPNHGFVENQSITIAGASISATMPTGIGACTSNPTQCEYNGTFSIHVIDANTFSYVLPTGNLGTTSTYTTTYSPPETFASAFGNVVIGCKKSGTTTTSYTLPITSITRVAGTGTKAVTVNASSSTALSDCSSTLATGNGTGKITAFSISGSNASNGLSGDYYSALSSVSGTNAASGTKTFVFNVTVTSSATLVGTNTIVPSSPATTSSSIAATGTPTRTVTQLSRTAGNSATVTATTSAAHGFGAGTNISISGAPNNSDGSSSEYNGSFSILSSPAPTSTTFSYQITTGPATSSTGGSVSRGSSVSATELINWVRGVDNKEDENIDSSLTDVRSTIHGDVLHSRPMVVNYGGNIGVYLYYGANDGTFHAIKGGQSSTDGNEIWSFVAPEHYSKLSRLYLNKPLIAYPNTSTELTPAPTKRDYFFDGNIGIYQTPDLALTHIFVAMRRGGRAIYGFDVSTPNSGSPVKFLWRKSYEDTGFDQLGQTWSEPKVLALRKTTGLACNSTPTTTTTGGVTTVNYPFKPAVVFGAGYDPTQEDKTAGTSRDNVSMGHGLFVLNESDGSLIKLFTPPSNAITGIANSTKRYSIPSEVSAIDMNGDGCVDRIYVGDTGGNIFRFDVDDANANNWVAYKIAAFGDIDGNGGNDDRKFLFPLDLALGVEDGHQIVYVIGGTGDREQPQSTLIRDKFILLKDTVAAGTASSAVTPVTLSSSGMYEVTDFNNSTSDIDISQSSTKGWYIDYKEVVGTGEQYVGEKSVNAATTVNGVIYFSTNRPMTDAERTARNSCAPDLGISRAYAVNLLNGTSAMDDRDQNGSINRADAYANVIGGGFPPTAVSGLVTITTTDSSGNSVEKVERFCIGCGGGTPGSGSGDASDRCRGVDASSIEGCTTEANPSSRRQRAFWYFKKDD